MTREAYHTPRTTRHTKIELHGLRVDKEMVELQNSEAEADLADAHRELERLKVYQPTNQPNKMSL